MSEHPQVTNSVMIKSETDRIISISEPIGSASPPAPLAAMTNSPFMGASDVWNIDPPSPGTGFSQIQQLFTLFGGKRGFTFIVVSGGTTLGVMFPHVRPGPFSPSSAVSRVAGSELLSATVTVQVRAPDGTTPACGGYRVGRGVGLGRTGGGGVGKGATGAATRP